MLKYFDCAITFQEFPDEISLCVNITGCPCRCPECHSQYLWEDIGTELTESEIAKLIKTHPHVSCFGIMGGDKDHDEVRRIAKFIKDNYSIKVGFYSGKQDIDGNLIPFLDYYKVGPYIKELGPLGSATTNQKLYEIKARK